MTLLEGLLPSFLLGWTPLNESGYTRRHALLLRLNSSVQRAVQNALRDRRLKMKPLRFFGGPFTLWRDNRNFRYREHIELVDDIPQAFSRAFRGNCLWKLMIMDQKKLALLVCDSLLLPVFAQAANIRVNSKFLHAPIICNSRVADESCSSFQTHVFHQDFPSLKSIAVKCATSIETVVLVLLIQGLSDLEEDFSVLLHTGTNAYDFQTLPRDPVACLRYCSRLEKKLPSTIEALNSRIASITFLNGNTDNNLLWHISSPLRHMGLTINVVISDVEGLILTLASTQLRREKLQYLDELFHSKLVHLMITLRLTWPDNGELDAKLSVHFEQLCRALSC